MPSDPLFDRLARALAGRYTLVRELGRGGMATVYLATDVKLGRQVAIKVLPPSTRAFLGSGRFQREVLTVAQFSHPHIVPLFEADEADGVLYYVMEYVAGESLQERVVREGALPVGEALRITAEVGEALQYAHERGVIHRDIKPANILLAHGHALVTDFGIAKLLQDQSSDQLTGTGVTLGTAEYMSPEQATGGRRIDARTDVYALAAVLYEMLAGEPPFTGPSVQAIVARVLSDTPRAIRTIRPDLPRHLEQALLAGLAKVPADRPASVKAFLDLLTRSTQDRRRAPPKWVWWTAGAAGAAATALVVLKAWPQPAGPRGMVLVPAGLYRVGGGPGRDTATARLDSFYIDSTEVTVAAYQAYLTSVKGVAPWTRRPPDAWPATGVLWAEAAAYCHWRDRRLPTEDEWEAAARGPQGLRYPWGDAWVRGRANADGVTDTLAPVGSFAAGASWVGAVDLIGNAWEWTATPGMLGGGSGRGGRGGRGGERGHVIKGGAFNSRPRYASAVHRSVLPEDRATLQNTGFRCAASARAGTASAPTPGSVAVLYFDNLSRDTADAYLADGLTEAVIGRLAQVSRLQVKSRAAVRHYRGAAAEDPAALGRALGVAHFVTGSVHRAGGRLRVTVELVRAETGERLWGTTYERVETDLLVIEEDVARAVATAIAGRLVPAERSALARRPTDDPVAYDHFLHGNFYLAQRTPRAVARAIEEYDAAARADPGFTAALGRAALGYGLFLDWGWDYPGASPDAVLARGFAATDTALHRDSATADAWMARGFLLGFRSPRTFDGVREALARAIALDSTSAEAYHQYGMTLLWLGDDSGAVAMYRHALAREPERPITLFNLARVEMRRGRYATARRWLDSALVLEPGADYAYALRGLAHLRLGETGDARADAQTAVRLRAGFRIPGEVVLALGDLAQRDSDAARARVNRLLNELPHAARPSITDAAWIGRVLVALGERQRALDLLERVQPRGARFWFYLKAPEFDAVRSDPRFARLAADSRPPEAQ